MKTLIESTPVESAGLTAEVTFSVSNSAKALRILTSNLYSNPVRSCAAELLQNCHDSHKMAGKADVPFLVTLPTALHCDFVARDFGVGMTHEFMMTKYTKAFSSTKENDNEQAGSMGLGRLCALSISDAFTVTCFDGSYKREYSVYFDSRGIPTIQLLQKLPDTEPRGVEVRVPVKSSQHNQFWQEIKSYVCRFYPTKPSITNKNWDGFDTEETALKGDGWSFPKHEAGARVVMGIYHFDLNADSINKLKDEHRTLINAGIILHVNLGDIDVSANRESIYYSDRTNAALHKALAAAHAEVQDYIQKEFDKCSNMLEAKLLYVRYFRPGGEIQRVGAILGEKPSMLYKGERVDGLLDITDGTKVVMAASRWGRHNRVVKKSDVDTDELWVNGRIYWADIPRYVGRLKERARNENNEYYCIVFKDDAAKKAFYAANKLEDSCAFTPISTLPKPERATSGEKPAHVYVLDEAKLSYGSYTYANEARARWTELTDDDDTPLSIDELDAGAYIVIDRYLPARFERDFGSLKHVLDILRKQDATFPKALHGIRKSKWADAEDEGWQDIIPLIKKGIETYFAGKTLARAVIIPNDCAYIKNKGLEVYLPEAAEALAHNKAIDTDKETTFMIEMAAKFGVSVSYTKTDIEARLDAALKAFYAKYPLLKHILTAWGIGEVTLKEYIELVDRDLARQLVESELSA